MPVDLAIIIPAYKSDFLADTLESLAKQTCKDFVLYIGDDCSPHNIYSTVSNFENRINIRYTRFDDNVGAKNLVKQWKRCVDLVEDERWIWLFADDDMLDSNCVEKFYIFEKKYGLDYSVIDFSMQVINKDGKYISRPKIAPLLEGTENMAYHLLNYERNNCMPQHIFRKDVYDTLGGFVETDYAQAADFASSILLSGGKGIVTIPDSFVYWRYSGTNISSIAAQNKQPMINGHLQFIHWVLQYFDYLKKDDNSKISFEAMRKVALLNLKRTLIGHYGGLPSQMYKEMTSYLKKNFGFNVMHSYRFILQVKFDHVSLKTFLIRLRRKLMR